MDDQKSIRIMIPKGPSLYTVLTNYYSWNFWAGKVSLMTELQSPVRGGFGNRLATDAESSLWMKKSTIRFVNDSKNIKRHWTDRKLLIRSTVVDPYTKVVKEKPLEQTI